MLTKHDAGYWTGIVPEDTVTLNDLQLMKQFMEKLDDVTRGADFEVEKVQRVTENDNACEWVIVQIYSSEIDARYWLVALIVDNNIGLRIYFQLDDLPPGTRDEYIEKEYFWLFGQPENIDDFNPMDLEYAADFAINMDDRKDVPFEELGEGAFACSLQERPVPSGSGKMLVMVKEYRTNADGIDNPLMMFVEVGAMEADTTLLTVMNGCDISTADVEVLHQKL